MLWVLSLGLLAPQEPQFSVENRSALARSEIVRVSMPFPRGTYADLERAKVGEQLVPLVPLLRWPDGSIMLCQAQVRVRLEPGARASYRLEPIVEPPADETWEGAWTLEGDLPLHTELEDPWGGLHLARLVPDPEAGPGGLVRSSPLVRVRRFRSLHLASSEATATAASKATAAAEKGSLGLVGLLCTFRGERRAELTLLLDNRALGKGPTLGPVRFRSFAVVTETSDLRIRPRFIRQNNLPLPTPLPEGGYRQVLLGPNDYLYLGDGTAKAYRFDLFLAGEGVTDEQRLSARAAAEAPLRALPDLSWTRSTKAFSAHGGPAPGPGRPTTSTTWTRFRWQQGEDFGPFGGFGDPRDAAAQGTPRNGPCALHNVLRWGSAVLLDAAEGMVLQHCLRPPPGSGPRLPEASKELRQGMSKRTLEKPHGFSPLDYEHFSVDLLYDYYWLTGDPLALEEMRRMGQGLLPLLRGLPFMTCRGEGWCMQAAVLISRATGDPSLVQALQKRFEASVLPKLGEVPKGYVLRQPPHADAFGEGVEFDAPWQMAAFLHGLHAMYCQTGDGVFRTAAVRTAHVMAGPGWEEEQGPKYFVSAVDPGRYIMPVGFGPREGTALMEIGAFMLAAEMTQDEEKRQLFLERARFIFAPYRKAEKSVTARNTWFQILLDREDKPW